MKILIIEDEAPMAMMMTYLLSCANCDVVVARTGNRGMELALEREFSVIVLDVDLPDLSGFEICRELKQRHISRKTPVVFVSGRISEQDRQHGLELGAADYIAKPFSALDFVSSILSHVNRAPADV